MVPWPAVTSFGTSEGQHVKDILRLQHRPHEGARAAGVGGVPGLHSKDLCDARVA